MAVLPCRDVSTGVIDVTQLLGSGGGGGAVSSVGGSGGGTGLALTGGPIGAVTLTLSGDLNVSSGGTGQTALTAGTYLKGNGINPVTLQAVPIPVADGGTGATAMTQGSVPFIGPAGVFTQDNPNLFYNDAENKLYVASGVLSGGVGDININKTAAAAQAILTVSSTDTAGTALIQANTSALIEYGITAAGTDLRFTRQGNTLLQSTRDLILTTPYLNAGNLIFATGNGVAGSIDFLENWKFNGSLNTLFQPVTLGNGLNSNIALPNSSYIRSSGPSAAFSVGGFTSGADGRILRFYNSASQTMTIVNEDASSTAVNRIKTLSGANATMAANQPSIVEFIWDNTEQRWILDDIGSSTGFIRADGTIPLTADWNAGLFNIKSKNSLTRFNIVTYGADPTGAADSTSAINAAITAAGTGGEVYIPPGTFNVTAAGTPIFLLTHPIHIRGDGYGSVIQVKTGTGAGVDIFTVTPATTSDATNYEFEDFRITAQSGTPGRHGIHVDITSNAALFVRELRIKRLWMDPLGGRAIKLEAPNPTNGIFACTIEDNELFGGINLVNCGDSIYIHNNLLTGANAAVDGTMISGAGALVIEGNNITSTGGISFPGGHATGPRIIFNNMELGAAFTGTNTAFIDLDGSGSTISNPTVFGNNIAVLAGGGTTNCLRLNLVNNALVDSNIFTTNAGGTAIVTTASAISTCTGGANQFTGGGVSRSIAGSIQNFSGAVFTQTANAVTTANTLTTLFGTGVGSLTLPANLLLPGKAIKIRMGGFISAADGGAGTKTLTLKLGGSSVATATSGATFTTVLNNGWEAQAVIMCRTTGAPGTVIGTASWNTEIATANLNSLIATANATTNATTTGTLVVDLQFNNGNATGTITTTWATVEVVN